MSEAEETQELRLDQLISKLSHLKKDIAHLEAEAKALKGTKQKLEYQIMDLLDDYGVTKAGAAGISVAISEDTVPHVDPDHWEEVWDYLFNNGYTELLRKQLNSAPYKELIRLGIEVPHVKSATVRRLNMTTSSK